jgi:hypothetical protein
LLKSLKRLNVYITIQILESNSKVKAVWKTVKKETGKYSTEEVTPSIKINDNAIQNPKLVTNTFNSYFLTTIERLNNDTTTLTTEDATKYLTETIPKTFPNINVMPTTVNEIESIINSLKSCGYDEITILLKSYQSISGSRSFPRMTLILKS